MITGSGRITLRGGLSNTANGDDAIVMCRETALYKSKGVTTTARICNALANKSPFTISRTLNALAFTSCAGTTLTIGMALRPRTGVVTCVGSTGGFSTVSVGKALTFDAVARSFRASSGRPHLGVTLTRSTRLRINSRVILLSTVGRNISD